jgi:hypothetical protein
MVHRRYGPGLPIEPLLSAWIVREMSPQNLDCDSAGVFRSIHLAHAARGEWRLNFMESKLCARGERHWCGPL